MSDLSNPYAAPVAPSPKAIASGSNRSPLVRAALCAGVSLAFALLAIAGIAATNAARSLARSALTARSAAHTAGQLSVRT
jgi:hypothetical protein